MNEIIGTYSDLAGKTVVVTGGSRGIGARTAKEFAAQGSNVCVVARDKDALDLVVTEINGVRADRRVDAVSGAAADSATTVPRGRAIGVAADVTDEAALETVRATVEQAFGPADILVAFAGGEGNPTPSLTLPSERWDEILDANVTSGFLAVRTFAPPMAERGHGAIVLMSSTAGRQASQANLAYGVAKAGAVQMARHLAAELGPQGVRVNCIAPSLILTEQIAMRMPKENQEHVAASHPLRRLGRPGDVAAAALFLASDASSFITGITIDLAGGRVTN